MMMALEMIMIYTNYLICANTVYFDMNDFYDDFKIEAEMINTAKHLLSGGKTLESYEIDEGVVNVICDGCCYYLECNGINLSLNVEDRMIIDYKVR